MPLAVGAQKELVALSQQALDTTNRYSTELTPGDDVRDCVSLDIADSVCVGVLSVAFVNLVTTHGEGTSAASYSVPSTEVTLPEAAPPADAYRHFEQATAAVCNSLQSVAFADSCSFILVLGGSQEEVGGLQCQGLRARTRSTLSFDSDKAGLAYDCAQAVGLTQLSRQAYFEQEQLHTKQILKRLYEH
eukprot:1163668-Amphidinium_carterae.2